MCFLWLVALLKQSYKELYRSSVLSTRREVNNEILEMNPNMGFSASRAYL